MRASTLLTIALAVVGAGCVSSDGIYCPPGDPRCAAVDVAIAPWNAFLPERCAIRRTNDLDGWLVTFTDHVRCESSTGGCLGFTDHRLHVIEVSASARGPELVRILTHEAGHARGLAHTCNDPRFPAHQTAPGAPPCGPVSRGVMDPDSPALVPTDIDLAEYRRAGDCP